MTAAHAFDALGEPVRRSIIEMLAVGPRSVQELADRLPISRPAVSQHLKVLSNAQLVSAEAVGSKRLYRLERAGVDGARAYLDGLWDSALARFALLANNTEESRDA